MESNSYEDIIKYLYEQLPMFQRHGAVAFKKDLTNIRRLCTYLGNPQDEFKSIHIAGTNGKGTTAHILSSIYQSAGLKVGVYTSPHYLDIRERIKIGNQLIEKESLIDFVVKLKPVLEDIKPSFFEMMVAMAFDYFSNQEVDLAIIETGLGGRLDSTNIISPVISVITNIGYDHQDMLGDTLVEIASEKAGIIKQGVPLVVGQKQKEVEDVFRLTADSLDTEVFFADDKWSYKIREENIDHYLLDIYEGDQLMFHLLEVDLKGEVLLKNLLTAIQTVQVWNRNQDYIGPHHLMMALSKIKQSTYFLGRMEVLSKEPLMIADSAHNEDGLKALFAEIDKIEFKKLHIVFGMVSDKPLSKVLYLLPKKAIYYAVAAKIPRAKPSEVLYAELHKAGLDVKDGESVDNGKKMALSRANPDDLLLICGSIFVVAEIKEIAVSLD